MRNPGQTDTALIQGDLRRKAILDAATSLIAEKGSHATSLTEIAQAAGVTRSGLLHHYSSKEQLIDAVFTEHQLAVEPFFKRLTEVGGLDAIECLIELAVGQVENPTGVAFWSMVYSENTAPGPSSPLRRRLLESYERYRAAIVGILTDAERRGELSDGVDKQAEAIEIIGCIEGLSANWLLDPEAIDLERAVRRYLERKIEDLKA